MGFKSRLSISLLLLLAFAQSEAPSGADEWWDPRWPYHIPAKVDTPGLSGDAYIAEASPDLEAALASLGARGKEGLWGVR